MRLSKIEIYGFKSFAERVEVKFEQGITGIVGPNGCGKSNLTDAVRWVLGEQSAKSLRGGKMEDVIFGGTEKRRKLQWCEVTLTIDNEDKALPVDFNEVAITRRIYRNGDSEYMINKTACRLRDIVELFRDTGVGKEGYSMIGQGRIDEILSNRSEDRRGVFEEAAGIVKYKSRKQEAERRLENTRLNVTRVEDVIQELEGRLEPLREQSQAAREYLQLREELKKIETNAFVIRSDRYNTRIGELKESCQGLGEAIEAASRRERELTDQREETEERLEALEREAADKREDVQARIRDVEAREGALNVLRERLSALIRERDRLHQSAEESQQEIESLTQKAETARARMEQETREADEAGKALDMLDEELTRQRDEVTRQEEEAERQKARLIESMNRLSDVKTETARLAAMREAIDNRQKKLEEDIGSEKQAADALAQRRDREECLLQEETEKKAGIDGKIDQVAALVRASAELVEDIQSRQNRTASQRQETATRLKMMEAMRRDFDGYQNSVKQVLLQARREGGAGVRGVVASLIRVPRDLERAVDMVLGGALQNVVVDREEDAKHMIDYLRGGRLGRATFLPISAVQGRVLTRDERRVLTMPGCVGLASELIGYDEEYRGIVENLLGRTVIAQDLDSGIAIMRAGRHAFRLVTLEGDVMHSGGSMTGGSTQSRMTSLLSREREIEEHKEKMAQLEAELSRLAQEYEKATAAQRAAKMDRTTLYDQLHQQEIAVTRAEAHVASARDAEGQALSRLNALVMEKARLEERRADIEKETEELASRQNEEESAQVMSQADIAALQREIAGKRRELDQRMEESQSLRVAQAARIRGLDALKADLGRMEAELTRLTESQGLDEKSVMQRDMEILSGESQQEEDARELAEKKESLNAARAGFEKTDAERGEARQRTMDIAREMDTLRGEMDQLTDKSRKSELQLQRLESELEQLQNRMWEDYELTYALCREHLDPAFKLAEGDKRVSEIKGRIKGLGAVNVAAVDEYRQTEERYNELSAQRDDLVKAQLDLQDVIASLVKEMEATFRSQFTLMDAYFRETFKQLFGGGHAELRLTDPKDVLNCGIDVVAQPPGKKLQMLSLLSGGERALTAIAILFAVLKLKPTPFCFLDEIEAALDDANIDRYAEYLEDFARDTQFVVITHRKGTMERCDALYGVAMEEKGVSKLVSVKLKDAV